MNTETDTESEVYFFNTMNGSLLVGQTAVEAELESGSNPADIVSLAELLTQNDRMVGPKDFEPMPRDAWDRTLDVAAIRWLHGVVSQNNSGQCISEEVITRAGYMGLVPRVHYFRSKPGGLAGLYAEAGLKGTRNRNLISAWTTRDFISYIDGLTKDLRHKPGYDDLVNASQASAKNPSPEQIVRKFGASLPQLFELAGYPDIKSWTEEDYIDWGVRFMFANDGKLPTSRSMAILSSRHRGPHYKSIYDNIGSLVHYQKLVQEKYELEMNYREQVAKERIEQIELEIEDGTYPRALFEQGETSKAKIAIYARYRLLQYLLPSLEEKYKKQNAKIQRPDWFVGAIQRANPALSAGQIETTASTLGLFDDIWPMDDYMDYLKV